ncbi:MAG: hypothetical protein GPJ54_22290 [Candidatus Heimdallarchaeota archaeon]|nr:hypothetical protein [Candidatus Heimdallarchaeota archaeon]
MTLFVGYLFQRFTKIDYSKYFVFLAIGSMLPDMIDKPIGALFFETGRWLGHSILVLTTGFVISWFIVRGRQFHEFDLTLITQILYTGSLFHIIEDVGISKVVVFWPLYGGFTSGESSDFLQGFKDPFTVIFEIIGLILMITMGISEKWRRRSWIILLVLITSYLLLFLTTYVLIVGF